MTVVCILGMHRSGTSATAKLLQNLGLYLGPEGRLFGPDPHNPDGYFEHRRIHAVNEAILRLFGGDWQNPPAFPVHWRCLPAMAPIREAARQALDQDFQGHPFWGWKEPRTCLTLPFWQDLVGEEMTYVVSLRNPLDVAASLERRDRMPFGKAVQLWIEYNVSALLYTAGRRRLIFSYDRYAADPEPEIRRLARFLDVGVPEAGSAGYDQVVGSFRPDLRHHRFDWSRVEADSRLTGGEKELARVLEDAAGAADGQDGLDTPLIFEHYRRVSRERGRLLAARAAQAEARAAQLEQLSRGPSQPSPAPAADFDRLVAGIGNVLEEALTGYAARVEATLDAYGRRLEEALLSAARSEVGASARDLGPTHGKSNELGA